MPPLVPTCPHRIFHRGDGMKAGGIRNDKRLSPLSPLYRDICIYSVITYHVFKGRYPNICLHPSENGGGENNRAKSLVKSRVRGV